MVTPHSLSKHQVMGATTGPVTAIGLMVKVKKELKQRLIMALKEMYGFQFQSIFQPNTTFQIYIMVGILTNLSCNFTVQRVTLDQCSCSRSAMKTDLSGCMNPREGISLSLGVMMTVPAGAGTKVNDPKRMFCEARHDFYQLLPLSEIKGNLV